MKLHYLTDDEGRQVAVVIPIEQWEAILEQLTDDEVPLTEEDFLAIREGKAEIERGELISLEELKRKHGL
jgi:PHD/YefM family antitoxin component YafN of YafNO toxin-antitoxin module